MADVDPGRKALAAMDAVLATRPERDGHMLAEATRHLAGYRDAMTPRVWATAPAAEKERLARLNAIISLIMALRFPIGEAPWDDFAAGRQWLCELLRETPEPAVPRR